MLNYIISFIPFIIYWGTCGVLELTNKGTLSPKQMEKNYVPKSDVFLNVMGVTLSSTLSNLLFAYIGIFDLTKFRIIYLILGVWWIDTAEFAAHFTLHKVNFLYKNFHKTHHQLHYPYHFGALYNSTFEAAYTSSLLFLGFYFIGFSFREFIFTTTLAYLATVIDHNYSSNENRFHYLHHTKYFNNNFQQPFFTYYDRLFGTYIE